MISVQKRPLRDIDISSDIVVAVEGEAGGGSIILDETLTNTSRNAVTSKGIWNKLASLSNEISTAAHTLDIQMGNAISSLETRPVSGSKIYFYLKDLSGQILDKAYEADPTIPPIDDYVSKTSTNAVKSSGIYSALSDLSSKFPTDYVKISPNEENFISSENTFDGTPVYFKSKDVNGPLVSFNISKHSHFTADGCQFVIPTKSDGIGPGGNITDNQNIKRINASTSADIIATREWTQKKIDNLPEQEVDTTYLIDKRYGGSISGNVEICQKDLFVSSGNFYGGENATISGRNSIAYGYCVSAIADNSYAFGDYTRAGTNLYRLRYGDISTNIWYLESVEGLSIGLAYSIRIANNYDNAGTILSINSNDNSISTTAFPSSWRTDEKQDNIISIAYDSTSDCNTLWIPGHPELGNIIIDECQIATGYGTIAQKWCAKAEGTDTIAAGKYSHAEGNATSAFGWASHAEGIETLASGQRSHAEGQKTSTFGSYSHAEGLSCVTFGHASHASGFKAIAQTDGQFVWNGNNFEIYDPTASAGARNGTFCINPINGINGFYIGNSTLGSMIGSSGNIDSRFNAINNSIVDIEDRIGISGYVECGLYVNSSWYNRITDVKVGTEHTEDGWGKNYSLFKYIVRGGKKYHFKTGFSANNAAALFRYDVNLDTPPENTISCLDYSKQNDETHPDKICEMDVVVPNDYPTCILAFTNSKSILPEDQVKVIAYDTGIPLNKAVEQNSNDIAELSSKLIGISNRLAEILA